MSEEPTTSMSITMVKVEPGGEQEPGIYWTFDEETTPETLWAGPFPDEESAVKAAQEAIQAAYAAAVETLFGEV